MADIVHITSGDMAGGSLAKAGLPGEVFVWHDVLYDGPRVPGWPDDDIIEARTAFLVEATGGGLARDLVLDTLRAQYRRLAAAAGSQRIVLWFDACLFDQAMLVHILACLALRGAREVELLCVDAFPGIEPFDGLGQLDPAQLASLYDARRPVSADQLRYAALADAAFALRDPARLGELARSSPAPLPHVPAAAARCLLELPDPRTGRGRLEQLALEAVLDGCATPAAVYAHVSRRDGHPQFWGDTTLWARINALAARTPPLVRIEGPAPKLPQWEGQGDLKQFRLTPGARPGGPAEEGTAR